MTKNAQNRLSDDEIERLDDRYLTKTVAVTALASVSTLLIAFVVYSFTTMANLNTSNELLKQEIQQMKDSQSEYINNMDMLNKNINNTNTNLKEIETILKNKRRD